MTGCRPELRPWDRKLGTSLSWTALLGAVSPFPGNWVRCWDPGLTDKAQTWGQQLLAPPPLCPVGWVKIPGEEAGQGAWAAGHKLRLAEGWLRVTPEPSSPGPEDPF